MNFPQHVPGEAPCEPQSNGVLQIPGCDAILGILSDIAIAIVTDVHPQPLNCVVSDRS